MGHSDALGLAMCLARLTGRAVHTRNAVNFLANSLFCVQILGA